MSFAIGSLVTIFNSYLQSSETGLESLGQTNPAATMLIAEWMLNVVRSYRVWVQPSSLGIFIGWCPIQTVDDSRFSDTVIDRSDEPLKAVCIYIRF